MESRKFYASAFSLAEMMVVMLIASIILAAMAPVVTTKMKSDKSALAQSSPWKWDNNGGGPNAYFATVRDTPMARAVIGQAGPNDDDTGRLVIRTENDELSHILFKRGNDIIGRLHIGPNIAGDSRHNTFSLATNAVQGPWNTALGGNALKENTTGSSNVAVGCDALPANTEGNDNVGVGVKALYKNTTGYENIAVGTFAAKENLIGFGNIAIGRGALNSNTAGLQNIAIGTLALNNLGRNNPTGAILPSTDAIDGCIGCLQAEYNTAVGTQALNNNQTGRANTAVGVGACYYVTGNYNTCIGEESGPRYATRPGGGTDTEYRSGLVAANGNTFIGSGANGKIYLRGDVVIDGNLLVEAKNTVNGFEVRNGRGHFDSGLSVYNGVDNNGLWVERNLNVAGWITGNSGLTIHNGRTYLENGLQVNNLTKMYGNLVVGGHAALNAYRGEYRTFMNLRDEDGHWGFAAIGTEEHHGDWNWDGDDGLVPIHYLGGGFDDAVNWVNSDRRLKYVGAENKSGLDKIRQLKVFNFTFKNDPQKTPHVGVIAQDLQKIFPNAVSKGEDGFLRIRKEDMFYAVVNAIKELDKKLASIEKTLAQLQKDNKQLKQENAQLKARLDKLEAKLK